MEQDPPSKVFSDAIRPPGRVQVEEDTREARASGHGLPWVGTPLDYGTRCNSESSANRGGGGGGLTSIQWNGDEKLPTSQHRWRGRNAARHFPRAERSGWSGEVMLRGGGQGARAVAGTQSLLLGFTRCWRQFPADLAAGDSPANSGHRH